MSGCNPTWKFPLSYESLAFPLGISDPSKVTSLALSNNQLTDLPPKTGCPLVFTLFVGSPDVLVLVSLLSLFHKPE